MCPRPGITNEDCMKQARPGGLPVAESGKKFTVNTGATVVVLWLLLLAQSVNSPTNCRVPLARYIIYGMTPQASSFPRAHACSLARTAHQLPHQEKTPMETVRKACVFDQVLSAQT